MKSVEEAQSQILGRLGALPVEEFEIEDALDRHLGVDLSAVESIPPFDNSAFDGYAVQSANTAGASAACPVVLQVLGVTPAGSPPFGEIDSGSCVRIFTGAPLPRGADAVVMQEDTRSDSPGRVEIVEPASVWEGVRFAGEDVRAGTLLLRAGTRLGPAQLSLAAAAGVRRISAHRTPRVALLSTGDELADPGHPLEPGKIPDSNRILLRALARKAGADIRDVRRVPDSLDATLKALLEASRKADVIVTTGGVSVGEADLLRPAISQLGGTVDLWELAMKPGKPFAFGRLGEAFWFGLPGNPVSAFVTWHLMVKPALLQLGGARALGPRRIRAKLAEPVANRGRRRHYVRVTLVEGLARAAGIQASHIQTSMAAADALLDVPPETEWASGREVELELLD